MRLKTVLIIFFIIFMAIGALIATDMLLRNYCKTNCNYLCSCKTIYEVNLQVPLSELGEAISKEMDKINNLTLEHER
jgi:hypothetical protein